MAKFFEKVFMGFVCVLGAYALVSLCLAFDDLRRFHG